MDDLNITMGEYIRLEEEKARKCGKVFDWETAKYGKIWYDEDIHDLRSVETEFPAIAFNYEVSSEKTLSCEPTVSYLNDEIDFRVLFDDSDNEDYTVIFDKNSFSYKIIYTNDLKTDSENDNEKVNLPSLSSPEHAINMALLPRDQRHLYLRYEGLQYTDANIADFEARLARIYRREVHMVQIIVALGLHMGEEMKSPSFARYWAESVRQMPDKGDLRDYWIGISSARDFLGTSLSYTAIKDSILRLCHRLIACSIVGRSQAPKKVTVTNLFYLRGMDVGSVNVPYLMARDTSGIDALRPKRQPGAAAGTPEAVEDAPVDDEGGQAVLAPVQAPQPPPPPVAARTMP
ncbi:hypothetical protein Tco_0017412 [Tanacetum coccineum]